jgi:3-oxoacyl-(acyl-carrier-protein) synthase
LKKVNQRVVVTGLSVIAPNGVGYSNFTKSLVAGISGIQYIPELKEIGMKCNIGGIPFLSEDFKESLLPYSIRSRIISSTLEYGFLAGIQAWKDAGLNVYDKVNWDDGVIFGSQSSDGLLSKDIVYSIYQDKNIRKIKGRSAEQAITSSVNAYLSGYIGLGNCSISNSAACATGTESILMAFNQIRRGESRRILAGSSEGNNPFIWSTLEKIRALNIEDNNDPEKASKPLSNDAKGLVPGCGSAALVLESFTTAKERGAKIYAEIIGGSRNSGGQRDGGNMTKPNPIGIIKCIQSAIDDANIESHQIDLISGHLTATYADTLEVKSWAEALNLRNENFPYINSVKSMTGHCLAAAGSIESVACISQISNKFIHPSINTGKLKPEILEYISHSKVPKKSIKNNNNYVIKANFGFGDVNACLVFKKVEL